MIKSGFKDYTQKLADVLAGYDWSPLEELTQDFLTCWQEKRRIFLCGNGGSAGNAMHIANDFVYGVSQKLGEGLRISVLSSNVSVLTCLANDEGYENIFSHPLSIDAEEGDVLIVLSGSGNSENILKAIQVAKQKGLKSYGILGFDGGKAREMVDVPLHFPVHDMQISEDIQLICMHMVMQQLAALSKGEQNA
ncbi:SIS domain-containing protein [Terasakiella pusilla]|uniref:SIS domain-containing protein n=1 Tax=Terasakiella pusilla TaxID=64973 RepID=UPI003AA91FD0